MYFLLEKVPLKLIYFYMRKSLSLSSLDGIIYCGAKFYMLVREVVEHSATQRESQKVWTAIKNWFLVDKVFLISFIIAIIAISLGGVTTRFFNCHVIVTVSGLMLVIGGFKETGLLQYLGQSLVKEVQQRVSSFDLRRYLPSF